MFFPPGTDGREFSGAPGQPSFQDISCCPPQVKGRPNTRFYFISSYLRALAFYTRATRIRMASTEIHPVVCDNLIGGESTPPVSGSYLDVVSPQTGYVIGRCVILCDGLCRTLTRDRQCGPTLPPTRPVARGCDCGGVCVFCNSSQASSRLGWCDLPACARMPVWWCAVHAYMAQAAILSRSRTAGRTEARCSILYMPYEPSHRFGSLQAHTDEYAMDNQTIGGSLRFPQTSLSLSLSLSLPLSIDVSLADPYLVVFTDRSIISGLPCPGRRRSRRPRPAPRRLSPGGAAWRPRAARRSCSGSTPFSNSTPRSWWVGRMQRGSEERERAGEPARKMFSWAVTGASEKPWGCLCLTCDHAEVLGRGRGKGAGSRERTIQTGGGVE